jgi:CAAX protease family protein
LKSWGIVASFGFAVLAFVLGQASGGAVLFAARTVDIMHLAEDGTALAIVTLVGNPIQVVTLVLAARLTGSGAMAYLALDRPRLSHVAISIAILVVVIAASDLATYALGMDIVPPFQLAINRTARADDTLAWLWLAVVVAAPVGEEILFRGFLFRGLVRDRRSALPGIVVIALVWAALHLGQYDVFSVALVGAFGVMLGYVRYLSGSTTLAILLHMLFNLESLGETVVALGWV